MLVIVRVTDIKQRIAYSILAKLIGNQAGLFKNNDIWQPYNSVISRPILGQLLYRHFLEIAECRLNLKTLTCF